MICCSLTRSRALLVSAVVALFLLGGCASTGDPRDPLEPVNRAVYKFNDHFDHLLAKPAAEFYRAVVPDFARNGVRNFFSNINDVIVALNNLLQGKVPEAIGDVGRILVNTTLGVLGFRDVATELGIPKNNEDFGQTLGYWGLGDGPYIVLPFLGASSLRDTVGWVGDLYTYPITYVDPTRDKNALLGLRFIDARTDLLEASAILETAALDPYEFVRDGYLQRRRYLVHDGKPPEEKDAEPGTEPKTDLKTVPKTEPKAVPKTDPKLEPKTEPKPAAKPLTYGPAIPDLPASAGSDRSDPALGAGSQPAPADLEERAATVAEAPKKQPRFRLWLPASRY